jgi:hypothetical protein
LVAPEHSQQATHDNEQPDCPTFFAGSLLLGQRGFEWVKHDENDKAVVALFTVVLALSTIGLWLATNRLWQSADETAKAQERDTRILQRAYINVVPKGLRLRIDGSSVIGHVGIHNAGNLPASNLSWFVNIDWNSNDRLDVFPLGEGKGKIVITPGTETTRGSGASILLQDLLTACRAAEISQRELQEPVYIYVWGVISYHDGFVAGRVTEFCHRYNWALRDSKYAVDVEHARLHEFGNAST